MLIKKVSSEKILTLCDFPVHNEHILKMYFHMYRKGQGKIVPPCPVLSLASWPPDAFGKTKKAKAHRQMFKDFLTSHPKVAYIVLDGTHKTTAAAFAGAEILVAVLRTNDDIREMKRLVAKGEAFSYLGEDTIGASLAELVKHFLKFGCFETVAEKTSRMVAEKVVPEYMIAEYRKVHKRNLMFGRKKRRGLVARE